MGGQRPEGWLVPFALIYFTFFLDNVLLTVLVPIIPDWLSGESPALDGTAGAAAGGQAVAGAVLSAKAAAQLLAGAPAARAVARRGPAAVLRAGTALIALAAIVLAGSGAARARGAGAAVAVGLARAAQGAGAAGAGVAGLALAAGLRAPLGALLGAVALGVLLGYPLGGALADLADRAAPFLLVAAALLLDLVLQWIHLGKEEYNRAVPERGGGGGAYGAAWAARRGAAGAAAGAVFLSTSVMAALEPCLPAWLARLEPGGGARWRRGLAFVPDSAAYFLAATGLGGAARAAGAERVALAGQAAVGGAALALPHARSLGALAGPHAALGAGLGALDAALLPALLTRAAPPDRLALAALLQTASSAAYVFGPVAGGALAAAAGFPATLTALGVANLLYLAFLYRALARDPLSEQWGAAAPADEEGGELAPLAAYQPLQ